MTLKVLKLNVYQSYTNENIYSYLHHHNIKPTIIIDFYLRAFKICSTQYSYVEEKDIENAFKILQYINYFKYNTKMITYEV